MAGQHVKKVDQSRQFGPPGNPVTAFDQQLSQDGFLRSRKDKGALSRDNLSQTGYFRLLLCPDREDQYRQCQNNKKRDRNFFQPL
ncbi:MAG: hypothetical protein STSR0003_06990 [Smithella sp.]